MTAQQIRFAQTPLGSVIGKHSVRPSIGRHTRNGRPPFSWFVLFRRHEKERTKKKAVGNHPCFLTAQKEKVFSICKRQFTRKKCRNSFLQKKERTLPMASVLFCQDLFVFDNTPEYCYNRYGNNSRHNGFRNPVGNTNSHNNIHYMI